MYDATRCDVYVCNEMPTHSLKLNYSRAHMAARASRKIKAAGGRRADSRGCASTMMIYAIVLSTDFCAAAISCVRVDLKGGGAFDECD